MEVGQPSLSDPPTEEAKQTRILRVLRKNLISGQFKPGTRLPSQVHMASEFNVSGATVQLALNRLVKEGFLYTRRRGGTFVVEKPPHLFNYGLIFHTDPAVDTETLWSRYFMALTTAARQFQGEQDKKIFFFHGINQYTNTEDYHRLVDFVETHRVAGLVFANNPYPLTETPILHELGMPRVAFMSQAWGGIAAITTDVDSFFKKALDYLNKQGRKRVALLGPPPYEPFFLSKIKERGMETHPYWIHPVSGITPLGVRSYVHLLNRMPLEERPNGLIISDDNLVESVFGGLVDAGVRVPEDIEVVAHCNFPCPPPRILEAKFLGFDMLKLFKKAIESIDQQRRGEKAESLTFIPAQFEEEK